MLLIKLLVVSLFIIDARGQNFVLFGFVRPSEVYPTCVTVAKEIGDGTGDPDASKAVCMKHMTPKASGADVEKHCQFFAIQLQQMTEAEMYHGPEDACGKVVQVHSNKLKKDCLEYLPKGQTWQICTDSIQLAIDQGAGATGKATAIQANIKIGCKMELEKAFKSRGLPVEVATEGCKNFVPKAEDALSAGELDPQDLGKQFCDGRSMQAKPFPLSSPSPMPAGFPLTKSDWKPKVTLANLRKMVRHAYGGPKEAFEEFDKDKDGHLSDAEWQAMCKALGIPKWDCQSLKEQVDTDGNGRVSDAEFQNAIQVTLPELVRYVLKKYDNAEKGWKNGNPDAVENKDPKNEMSPEEFTAHCKAVGVTPENADKLFPEVDADNNGTISEEEYKNVFGVTVPELRRRVKDKFGDQKAGFDAFDTDKSGELSPQEFAKGCDDLGITPERAEKLFAEIDADGSGGISPEEWKDAMTMTPEELRHKIYDKLGKPEDVMKKGDKDGDGKMTADEVKDALKKAGMDDKEAEEVLKAMDKDGDGQVSEKEWLDATGAKDMAKKRYAPAGPEKVTLPELKKRAHDKWGTPEKAFRAMDKDGDGLVSPEEFKAACQKLNVPKDQVPGLFNEVDGDQSRQITPEEWYKALRCTPEEFYPEAEVTVPDLKKRAQKKNGTPKDAFNAMDINPTDGKISPEEFKNYCAGLDPPIEDGPQKKLFDKLDKDKSGFITPDEWYQGTQSTPEEWYPSGVEEKPREGKESPVSMPEATDRLKKAFGNGKKAWEAMDPDGDGKMTPEEWKERAADLGIPPGEAEKLFKEMDKDGDGVVDEAEFQNALGVDEDELQDRMLDEFGSAAEALKAADADGDGKVSKDELKKLMEDKLGLTPEQAEKMAEEQMKKLDPDGDGKIEGEAFKDAFKAKADDLAAKISEKFGSAAEAMNKWDTDGDGKVSEEEFLKGAAEMGISEEAARDMYKKANKDGDGGLDADEFKKAFGITPDDVLERCFEHFGNPEIFWDKSEKNQDGLISPEEWEAAAKRLKLTPEQAKKVWADMNTNHKENTQGHISKWEFFTYLDYEPPPKVTWGDGYGDIDPFGRAHKKFNELPSAHGEPPILEATLVGHDGYGDIDSFGHAHKPIGWKKLPHFGSFMAIQRE